MDRSEDTVRPIEDLERNARAARRHASPLQSEGREPIGLDDEETGADPRRKQLFVECRAKADHRRRVRALWWGGVAAAALGVFLAAVVFDAEIWRGRNSSSSAPRLELSVTPATSEAPAASVTSRPPFTESPSPTDRVPAPVAPEEPLPPHVESPPLPAETRSTLPGKSDRGGAASRRSEAGGDSIHVMAGRLIAKLGHERAEETARSNATWYTPGSETSVYWQRVADTIRTAQVPR